MTDTTSIDDLPTDPSAGNQNNVTIQKTEMNNGMRGGGGMGGMVDGGMMNNQVMPQAQVYSPNVAGVNMMGGGMGGGMGMQMPQQQQQMQQQQMQQMQQQQMQMQPQQNVMNELVNGLQRASASGLTNLPSRDIPINTMGMMNDAQINPNYVPQNHRMNEEDYISQHEEEEMNEVRYSNHVNRADSMENIYKLIQVPLLVGVLYFAFQLPVFRKYMLKYIPSVFNGDGNYNISGLVFVSALFGLGYFGLTRVLDSVAVV
jgi:hypothetical protein